VQISTLLAGKGTAVDTIRGDATVDQAVAELSRHRIGALVVSSDGQHIEGIISERDVVRMLHELGDDLVHQPVSSIMSTTVYSCTPEDDTDLLMNIMTDRRIRHVPVVKDGVLCGIVSIGDVVKSRIGDLEKDRAELFDYINAR
jgi:CBS domain-containing protein